MRVALVSWNPLIFAMSQVGQLLIETITHTDPEIRDRSVRALVADSNLSEKLEACAELEDFRRNSQNLYERVRASLFLSALFRFDIQDAAAIRQAGLIPYSGFMDLMERRYEPAIASFLETMKASGPDGTIASALARLRAERVPDSGRPGPPLRPELPGQPLDVPRRRCRRTSALDPSSIALARVGGIHCSRSWSKRRPVRLDLSHSGWSDIFFLGMDFPEGARVLNISVDLGVHGRDRSPPPDRVRAAGDHRTDPAPDQYRSERMQGRR